MRKNFCFFISLIFLIAVFSISLFFPPLSYAVEICESEHTFPEKECDWDTVIGWYCNDIGQTTAMCLQSTCQSNSAIQGCVINGSSCTEPQTYPSCQMIPATPAPPTSTPIPGGPTSTPGPPPPTPEPTKPDCPLPKCATSLSASCSSDGNSVTLSWSLPADADADSFREMVTDNNGAVDAADFSGEAPGTPVQCYGSYPLADACRDDRPLDELSVIVNIIPNTAYDWIIGTKKTRAGCGNPERCNLSGTPFTCAPPTPTPTPTPYVRIRVFNSELTPFPTSANIYLGLACYDSDLANFSHLTTPAQINNSSDARFALGNYCFNLGMLGSGGGVRFTTPGAYTVIGVTPTIMAGYAGNSPCTGESWCAGWTDTWAGGGRRLDFIVTTPTPTLTPTSTPIPTSTPTPLIGQIAVKFVNSQSVNSCIPYTINPTPTFPATAVDGKVVNVNPACIPPAGRDCQQTNTGTLEGGINYTNLYVRPTSGYLVYPTPPVGWFLCGGTSKKINLTAANLNPAPTIQFNITDKIGPWTQTVGGNAYRNDASFFTSAVDQYFNIAGAASSIGLVSGQRSDINTLCIDSTTAAISCHEAAPDWKAGTYTIAENSEANPIKYDDFFQKLGTMATAETENAITAGNKPTGDGIFKYTGTITINTGAFSNKQIYFIDGDLIINQNITLAANSFLAFFVSGSILVNSSVTNLDGIYLTGDTGDYFVTGAGTAQLIINGSVITHDLTNQRELIGGVTDPSVKIIFNPALILNAPDALKHDATFGWNEVAE